jgi:DNA transformation protein
MAATSEFAAHCAELLGKLGPVRIKRMFGGHGFYVDEVFVALASDDRLYLKVDAQTRPRFEAAGCEPFVYDSAGKQVSLGYWTAPDDAMESPALMLPWTRLAMEAALRARNAKPARSSAKRPKPISPAKAPAKKTPAARPKKR